MGILIWSAIDYILTAIPYIVFICIIYLIYRLTLPNPFYRNLFSKKYTLQQIGHTVHITFKRSALNDPDLFRVALYDCMYTFPDTDRICFENINRSINRSVFEHFSFECLDFSHISSSTFNCNEPFTLPASYIILPKDAEKVPLRYCHPDIQKIGIPSRHFVPAQEYITFPDSSTPIRVHSSFAIYVPFELVDEYRKNPVWNSILLIDENDEIFHLQFYGSRFSK